MVGPEFGLGRDQRVVGGERVLEPPELKQAPRPAAPGRRMPRRRGERYVVLAEGALVLLVGKEGFAVEIVGVARRPAEDEGIEDAPSKPIRR